MTRKIEDPMDQAVKDQVLLYLSHVESACAALRAAIQSDSPDARRLFGIMASRFGRFRACFRNPGSVQVPKDSIRSDQPPGLVDQSTFPGGDETMSVVSRLSIVIMRPDDAEPVLCLRQDVKNEKRRFVTGPELFRVSIGGGQDREDMALRIGRAILDAARS